MEVNKIPFRRHFRPPVRFQQPAQTRKLNDPPVSIMGPGIYHSAIKRRVQTLMVIILQKFFQNIPELGLQCQNKVIQTLLFEGLYKGFHVAVTLR